MQKHPYGERFPEPSNCKDFYTCQEDTHTDAELILMETIQWKFCGTWDHNLLGFVYSNPNVERQALQRPPR